MRLFDDDNYCDFWIRKLQPEYKYSGEREFLREDECSAASDVTKLCEGQSRGVNSENEQWFIDWLKGEEIGEKNADATDNAVIVHKIDGKIVGICCTCIYAHDNEKGAVVWIRWIDVIPEYQNRGIGRNLLMQTLQYGIEHGAKRAFLAVDLENKNAVKLYESIGFIRD
jgi:ribosomal protein S18 acetylase RimI-like enzyme